MRRYAVKWSDILGTFPAFAFPGRFEPAIPQRAFVPVPRFQVSALRHAGLSRRTVNAIYQ